MCCMTALCESPEVPSAFWKWLLGLRQQARRRVAPRAAVSAETWYLEAVNTFRFSWWISGISGSCCKSQDNKSNAWTGGQSQTNACLTYLKQLEHGTGEHSAIYQISPLQISSSHVRFKRMALFIQYSLLLGPRFTRIEPVLLLQRCPSMTMLLGASPDCSPAPFLL